MSCTTRSGNTTKQMGYTQLTSTLSQRKGQAPQPSITWGGGGSSMMMTQTWLHKAAHFITCNFGGVARGSTSQEGVLHDNDDADVTP